MVLRAGGVVLFLFSRSKQASVACFGYWQNKNLRQGLLNLAAKSQFTSDWKNKSNLNNYYLTGSMWKVYKQYEIELTVLMEQIYTILNLTMALIV